MPKPLKIGLIVVGALIALLVIAGAIVAATFDPNAYKPLIIERVQKDKQRTLAIPGTIKLSFFPKLGVELGAVSLSEHASTAPFASVQSARVSLALMPLLRKQVVVDRISVDGLRATLKRTKDGKTNIDDLLGPPQPKEESSAPPGQATQFDVAGVSVTDAAITIDDELNARHLELTRAEISSGRIAPGTPGDVSFKGHVKANQPLLDADVALKGELLLDPPHKRYAFKKLSAEVEGRVATLSALKAKLAGNADLALEPLALDASDIELTAQGKPEQGELQAKLSLPQLKFGEKDITAKKIEAQLTLKQGARTIHAQLALPSFDGAAQAFKIAAIGGEFSLDEGPMQAKGKLSGSLEGDIGKVAFASPLWTLALDGRKGDTAIKGTLSTPWTANFKTQAIDLTRIAADVQLPNPKGGALALKASGVVNARLDKHTVTALLSGKLDQSAFSAKLGMSSFTPAAYSFDIGIDQIDADRYRASTAAPAGKGGEAAAQAPIDLSALKNLNATGSLRVGALQFAGLKTSNVKLDVRAAGGKLDIAPLTANLYQGSVSGSLSAVASTPPRFAVKQTLSGVSIGPLLKDLAGSDRIEGRGNVVLDVSAQGASVSAIEKGLNGSARMELRDGAVRGINVAQALRKAKAALGGGTGAQQGAGSKEEKTDFSELTGSFRIANGVAHNEDLLAKSPLLRVTGNGDIDIGNSRLNYLVKATVVATLQGQGGPELQALRGQTIPVRLSGPFDKIGYSIDFAGLAQEMAKQKVEEKLKSKVPGLGDKLKGLFGR